MDLNKLKEYLNKKNIPMDSYSINEINSESLCIINNNICWSVFYYEKGLKTDEFFFDKESSAIEYFLGRLSNMLEIDL